MYVLLTIIIERWLPLSYCRFERGRLDGFHFALPKSFYDINYLVQQSILINILHQMFKQGRNIAQTLNRAIDIARIFEVF